MRKGTLKQLFLSTLYLSAFTFGGGYVIVTLLKNKFVDELHWIDEEEMLDLVAIAQSSPGPIAVNGAVVVGYKLYGIPGVLAAISGAILPPFVILTAVSIFYQAFRDNFLLKAMLTGMKAGVGAVVISVVWDMGKSVLGNGDKVLAAILILSFIAGYFLHVNVILIILGAAAAGIIRSLAVKEEKGVEK